MLLNLVLSFLLIFSINASCSEESLQWPINENGSCYFFETQQLPFSAAEVFCARKCGHLTSIHDAFVNSILAEEAQTRFTDSTVTDFWIGLTNLMPEGNWTWTDGTSTNFKEWASDEPKNISDANSAALSLVDGFWRSAGSFKTKPFICKIEQSQFQPSTTSTPTTTPKPKECPLLWIYFEPTNSCYGDPFYKGPMNWTLAEGLCLSIGSHVHLASIHSMEERNFLETLHYMAYDWVWTGAFSNDAGKTWKWSDGTPWDFDPWATGNPSMNTSAYGRIWGGGLYDVDGSAKVRIVCKYKL